MHTGRARSMTPYSSWRARLTTLVVLVGSAYYISAEFAPITNTVYDCQYDLSQEQCGTCTGIPTLNTDEFDPKSASCISSQEGCCKSQDGYEYFRKDSLASYGVGDTVLFFYPGESGARLRLESASARRGNSADTFASSSQIVCSNWGCGRGEELPNARNTGEACGARSLNARGCL